jgi:hypothetical protein
MLVYVLILVLKFIIALKVLGVFLTNVLFLQNSILYFSRLYNLLKVIKFLFEYF